MTDKVYLALGDSMSIDLYTGVEGGGAAAQFFRSLGDGWRLADYTRDGCVIAAVPRGHRGDLITLTIGGNDLLFHQQRWLTKGLGEFNAAHLALLRGLRARSPEARFIVGNVYAPEGLDRQRLAVLDEANQAIAANAASVGARLVDLRSAFRGHEAAYLCALVEPTLAGATAIAALFREAWASPR